MYSATFSPTIGVDIFVDCPVVFRKSRKPSLKENRPLNRSIDWNVTNAVARELGRTRTLGECQIQIWKSLSFSSPDFTLSEWALAPAFTVEPVQV